MIGKYDFRSNFMDQLRLIAVANGDREALVYRAGVPPRKMGRARLLLNGEWFFVPCRELGCWSGFG